MTPARSVSLALVLAALCGTLVLGFMQKSPCIQGDWAEGIQFRTFCYSDIYALYQSEHLESGRLPYLESCENPGGTCDEYPPVTMYAMRLTAYPVATSGGFFVANAALLAAAAIATALFLWSMVGERTLFFALAPSLIAYSFMNWDLLAVAAATAATWAFLRQRDLLAGGLLAVGIAAKLYPGLLLVAFVIDRVRARKFYEAGQLAFGTAFVWLAINLPFMTNAPDSWLKFWRFNATRWLDFDSLWAIVCDNLLPGDTCPDAQALNVLSLVLLVAIGAGLYWLTSRLAPDFPRWTFAFPLIVVFLLTSKVYSPQYSLWLIPWFALVLPNIPLFVAFSVADIAVFVTRFSWFSDLAGYGGMPKGAFQVAIVLRAAVLSACVAAYVLRQRDLPEAQEETELVPQPA